MERRRIGSGDYWLSVMQSVIKSRSIYLMILPGAVWYIAFAYLPMGGLMLAFKQFRANLGIIGSPWIGFENFTYVFRDARFFASITTTFVINFCRILFAFPFPIILALALNEVRVNRYKKVIQTVYTFPHFLSWVIVSGILVNFLALDGFVNSVFKSVGLEPINFLGSPDKFRPIVYLSAIWKSSGWSAIIYLAAIAAIEIDQYEAAEIDGASRIQRVLYVTLPNISGTIIVMLILACGDLMTAGFDQVFNLNNAAFAKVSETIDMYIYNITFQGASDFGFSTAVSLFRSVANLLLLLGTDKIMKSITGSGLFGMKEVD